MIFTHNPFQTLDLGHCAGVPDQFSYTERDVTCQDFVVVLGNPT